MGNKKALTKDEHYVLDIGDRLLGLACSRQHKFDFLIGDVCKNGKPRKLPVDGYYEKHNLVIEYNERQHTESVKLFDRRMTISGVPRGEQRSFYFKRKIEILPKHGIKVLVISYFDFNHNIGKRINRNYEQDKKIIRKLLQDYI